VTSVSRAKAEPRNFGDIPYIGLEHIESGSNHILRIGTEIDVKSTKNVFQHGDVLYGKLRPYLKKVCRPDFDGVCSTDILVFSESSNLDNDYLLYFLLQDSTADYATQNSNGINLPRINSRALGEIEFPLPPLAEQQRIVAKIEALQERSRRTRKALAEVGPLLEQFRQSVLAAAFRGDLTTDWRAAHPNVEPASELLHRIRSERRRRWEQAELAKYEAQCQKPPKNWRDRYEESEPVAGPDLLELPDGWAWVSLGFLIEMHGGFAFKSKEYMKTGIPILRMGNILRDFTVDLHKKGQPFISESRLQEFNRYILNGGEMVMTLTDLSKSGHFLGTVARVPDEAIALLNQRVAKVDIMPEMSAEFVFYALQSPRFRSYMAADDTGTIQQNTNHEYVCAFVFACPPRDEQDEIARRLQQVFTSHKAVKDALQYEDNRLDQLDQSILAKAFRGELVPQDPNDEPASSLLARIREQRIQ
jgi:type I restriction enzyme S subunit